MEQFTKVNIYYPKQSNFHTEQLKNPSTFFKGRKSCESKKRLKVLKFKKEKELLERTFIFFTDIFLRVFKIGNQRPKILKSKDITFENQSMQFITYTQK